MNFEDLWKKLREEYKKVPNILSVNLPSARQFLLLSDEKQANKLLIWYIINCISPVIVLILSFILLGLGFGILSSVIYFIIWFYVIGYASYNTKKCEKNIWIMFVLGILIGIFTDIPILYIAFLNILLLSITSFYEYINIIIIESALNNIMYFDIYLRSKIITVNFNN